MRPLKLFFRCVIGSILVVYLLFLALANLPPAQRWIGSKAGEFLSGFFHTTVTMGRAQVGLNGRLILDDVYIEDLQHDSMLCVKRAAVKINLLELLHKRICIGNAQLYGIYATLYQDSASAPLNCQFFIDALSNPNSDKPSHLDLQIAQIVVRRGNIQFDKRWQPKREGRFSPHHIKVTDLALTAELNALTTDSIDLEVKRFDGKESSGLCINALELKLRGNSRRLILDEFCLKLPDSELRIPQCCLSPTADRKSFTDLAIEAEGHLSPNDLTPLTGFSAPMAPLHFRLCADGGLQQLHAQTLELRMGDEMLSLDASGYLSNLSHPKQMRAELDIHRLHIASELADQFKHIDVLERLAFVDISGHANYADSRAACNLSLATPLGSAQLSGQVYTDGYMQARLLSPHFNVGQLAAGKAQEEIGAVAVDVNVEGKLPKEMRISGTIPFAEFKNYRYHDIALSAHVAAPLCDAVVSISDPNAEAQLSISADLRQHFGQLDAAITSFAPHALHFSEKYPDTFFSGNIQADLSGHTLDDLVGRLYIEELEMTTPDGTYRPGSIHIASSRNEDGEKHLTFVSPFLEAQVNGAFRYATLSSQFLQIASNYLPTLVMPADRELHSTTYGKFDVRLYSAEPLQRLLDLPLTIGAPILIHGEMDAETRSLALSASAPDLQYGKEILRQVELRVESNQQSLLSTLQLERRMKGRFVSLGMETRSVTDKLHTRLFWNNQNQPVFSGDVALITQFFKDKTNHQAVRAELQPSTFLMADTLWTVHPGTVAYHDGKLYVDSLRVSSEDRFLTVFGRASGETADTLHAQFRAINLDYIFQMVNFHAVDFTGKATGKAFARSLFSKPVVDAYVQVPEFALNNGELGDLSLYGNWGHRPYSIFLDGVITDTHVGPIPGTTMVQGYITPKKDIAYHGLDLKIQADRSNLFFLNKFTAAIFDDLRGRASGWARLFGPFKGINLEGDVLVDEASVGIPFTGVRYHLEKDSVHMRPGIINFADATIYDPQGRPDARGHKATVNGRLTHDHFSQLHYDISLLGDNILGYDFRDFSEMPFYGTVFATGDVRLSGKPGACTIDIKAQPQRGTSITYNMTSPDKITESSFLTFVDRSARTDETQQDTSLATIPLQPSSDLRINFDLDIDNRSSMNLLTDARSGDMISVEGYGHMIARFYNKGNFQLYGTYHVERGTYNLSLQEIVRKNFDFQNGGTITFAGDPMGADLRLQATHTVSGVSLNDISARANFSNNSARVKCLMNVTGKARQPRIAFDFDILNVNEDEKQMVRSLISTEEERNMQVVYLLGIGRFYTYEYNNDTQSQGTTAMNSLLSSTLSGQINQMLSNVVRSKNWNFGANLSTGEMGWNDMDVEGMLQGSLLNNRLLFNGQFGYRDNPALQGNFVGDFEARYLLTRTGGISLKAYSETNDRYFTKTSLTTQGIGILLKRDFLSWKDFLHRQK